MIRAVWYATPRSFNPATYALFTRQCIPIINVPRCVSNVTDSHARDSLLFSEIRKRVAVTSHPLCIRR